MLIRVRDHVGFYLISIGQAVGTLEHIYHGDDFSDGLVIQSEPLHGGTMGVNSVRTMDHFWIWNCGAMVISMRRFIARPASVALDASGRMDP